MNQASKTSEPNTTLQHPVFLSGGKRGLPTWAAAFWALIGKILMICFVWVFVIGSTAYFINLGFICPKDQRLGYLGAGLVVLFLLRCLLFAVTANGMKANLKILLASTHIQDWGPTLEDLRLNFIVLGRLQIVVGLVLFGGTVIWSIQCVAIDQSPMNILIGVIVTAAVFSLAIPMVALTPFKGKRLSYVSYYVEQTEEIKKLVVDADPVAAQYDLEKYVFMVRNERVIEWLEGRLNLIPTLCVWLLFFNCFLLLVGLG